MKNLLIPVVLLEDGTWCFHLWEDHYHHYNGEHHVTKISVGDLIKDYANNHLYLSYKDIMTYLTDDKFMLMLATGN